MSVSDHPKNKLLAKQKAKEAVHKKKPARVIEENKYAVYGLLVVFLTLVFFAASYKISGDDDLFWHLATGRYIVENKVVPDKDVFGHVTSGAEWIPFEWGWDVLSYGLYNIGGYNAILAFRSIAFCFIFYMMFLLLRKFKVNTFLAFLLLFLLLIGIMDRLSPRPHIITYILFTLLLYILLNYKYFNRTKYSRGLYLLPLVFLVWANSHMGVLAGGLVLFIFVIAETIIFVKPSSYACPDSKALTKEELKRLWIISIICALILLVNPHGISTYIYAYGHTKMKMLATVNEWQNPFTDKVDFGITLAMYKLFLYCGVLVLIYSYLKKDILFTLIFAAFAVYSVRAIRFTVDYDIVMLPFIAISINYLLSRIRSPEFAGFMNGNVTKAIIGAFFVYITFQVPSNAIYEKMQYYRVSGWGINSDFIPVQMYDFMKESGISGKPFNHFGTGGYIVWSSPHEKNFIDSRNLNDEIFNEYNSILSMRPGFEKKLEERGIDYFVYLDPDLIRRPNDLKGLLTAYCSRDPNWKLVFWDDKSMLFVKNIPKFAEVINKYGYKVLNPYTFMFFRAEFDSNVRMNPQAAKDELGRKLKTDPSGVLFQNLNQAAGKLLQGM